MQEAVVAPLAALLLAACCRTAHAAGLMTSAACRLRYAFEVGCLLCRGAWLVCPIWRSQRVGALSWIELWKTVAATFPARKAAPLASCLLTVFLVEESDDDQDDPGRQSGRSRVPRGARLIITRQQQPQTLEHLRNALAFAVVTEWPVGV